MGLDEAVADELREFALALKKLQIIAPRCAEAAKVVSMMINLGTGELHILVIPSYRASGASEQMKCGLRSGAAVYGVCVRDKSLD